MSIEPQSTPDKLPDLPQLQKDLIDLRLAEYHNDPSNTLDWDEAAKQFDREDETV